MIVCSCNVLSDKSIRACLAPGPDCPLTAAQVYRCLGCSPQCGRCARTIRQIVNDTLPSVHLQCTTQCSTRCPLTQAQGAETGGEVAQNAPIAKEIRIGTNGYLAGDDISAGETVAA